MGGPGLQMDSMRLAACPCLQVCDIVTDHHQVLRRGVTQALSGVETEPVSHVVFVDRRDLVGWLGGRGVREEERN